MQSMPRSTLKPTSTDTSIFPGTPYQTQLANNQQQIIAAIAASQQQLAQQNLQNPLMNNPLLQAMNPTMNPLMVSHSKQYGFGGWKFSKLQ